MISMKIKTVTVDMPKYHKKDGKNTSNKTIMAKSLNEYVLSSAANF
jgi:hypothetical protein